MKIAIGYRLKNGPWGGGNRFAKSLAEFLYSIGHQVVYDLYDDDIDIILLTDPRSRSPNVAFGAGSITRYLLFRNSKAVVVHRINECDERKGTGGMNNLLVRANFCADYTTFVGSWMLSLDVWKKNIRTPHQVILNGADAEIFNSKGMVPWNGSEPLKLVTHHWGGNWMKGFDIYQRIDQMLAETAFKNRLEFTYIGNLPKGFHFKNARLLTPLDGMDLAAELKRHHAYVTGSINEPGGNHQNEAAACGLPLLFRRSGCLPEYCDRFGLSFDENDFEIVLEKFFIDYKNIITIMPLWPHYSKKTCQQYLTLFEDLLKNRDEILIRRKLWTKPWNTLRNLIS